MYFSNVEKEYFTDMFLLEREHSTVNNVTKIKKKWPFEKNREKEREMKRARDVA